jgi:predicted acyl esterase
VTSIAIERDLAVPTRDGMCLFANLFRLKADRPCPVILSVTPYGNDKLPDRLASFFMPPFGRQVRQAQLLAADGLRIA